MGDVCFQEYSRQEHRAVVPYSIHLASGLHTLVSSDSFLQGRLARYISVETTTDEFEKSYRQATPGAGNVARQLAQHFGPHQERLRLPPCVQPEERLLETS